MLLGLRGQPTELRSELGEDVLDAGEVGRRLVELLLGAPPAALVAADTRHLLEEGSPLFRSQGQGLVDHALADEEEGIVREMGRVKEVDEVLEAHALAIDEVVVLARPKQAPAHLEDRVLHGDEPVRVVEDKGDVSHAQGGASLRAREHDVLGAA